MKVGSSVLVKARGFNINYLPLAHCRSQRRGDGEDPVCILTQNLQRNRHSSRDTDEISYTCLRVRSIGGGGGNQAYSRR